jgi:site-specific DNA-methyltransferase (adenine-specific)
MTGNSILLFENEGTSYISREEITKNLGWVNKFKVIIPASGSGSDVFPHPILGTPFVGKPGTACTETYCVIGPFDNESICKNAISYISTRFFRFLVMLRKPTQHAPAKVYTFVPIQDFSLSWTDEELYAKYGLNDDEIAFIESMIKPMDLGGGDDAE